VEHLYEFPHCCWTVGGRTINGEEVVEEMEDVMDVVIVSSDPTQSKRESVKDMWAGTATEN
jgi:hypothetical protein